MWESLIAIQAILCNVNGAAIPRSISTSHGATTFLINGVTPAISGYSYASHPRSLLDGASARRRFSPSSLFIVDRQASLLHRGRPGWRTPRLSSTLSSQSSSRLFAASSRGGGGGEQNDSKLHYSTSTDINDNKSDQDIEIPFREYGYRSTPFTWEELDQIINQEQNLAKLSRSVPQEQVYQLTLRQLKQEWKSTKDYILHSKFNLPKELDKETQLYFVNESTAKQQEQVLRKIVLNDFPYYCAPGIEHWVLWKYGGGGGGSGADDNSNISMEDVGWAKKEILRKLTGNDATMVADDHVIWWENPTNLKSLPEISHVHMLIRRNILPNEQGSR